MPEYFFDLGIKDRLEALEFVRAQTSRPAHLLEQNDEWAVQRARYTPRDTMTGLLTGPATNELPVMAN